MSPEYIVPINFRRFCSEESVASPAESHLLIFIGEQINYGIMEIYGPARGAPDKMAFNFNFKT